MENEESSVMFGQLSNRESLRDLIVAFEAHRAKQYHLGLGREPIAMGLASDAVGQSGAVAVMTVGVVYLFFYMLRMKR